MSVRVLLIDDETRIARAMSARLRSLGYETMYASDGESGIAAALEHAPDAILLDIRMPGIDGFEVYRRLNAQAAVAHIPVIFVSANAHEADRDQALSLGGAAYFTKPYKAGDVVAVIERLISDKEACFADPPPEG